jgi:hypothetical protein
VDTPAGPRLIWQPGAPAQAASPLALAPMPPPRPEDPVTTGALAFAPLPPIRPGALSAQAALVLPEPAALRGSAGPAALAPQAIEHPFPPRRPDARPPAAPVAVASAAPVAVANAAPEPAPAQKEADRRAQLRQLLAAAPSVPARAPAPAGPTAAGRTSAAASPSILSGAPTLAMTFTRKSPEDPGSNRFTGSALKPAPLR